MTIFILFLRSLGCYIGIILMTLIVSILLIFPKNIRQRFLLKTWGGSCLWCLKYIGRLDYKIIGLENLENINNINNLKTGYVVLSKHSSYWETIALMAILTLPIWVSKKEVLKWPIIGHAIKVSEAIIIDRSKPREAIKHLLSMGKKYLKLGRPVLIFPEGSRDSRDYKTGGIRLAKLSHAPIILIAHNAQNYWPKSQFLIKPGLISVKISPPIFTDNQTIDVLLEQTKNWIESNS